MILTVSDNIKEAWLSAYLGMLEDKKDAKGRPYIDYYQRNIVHSFGNKIVAKHGVMPMDLGEIGMTVTKWTKFTNMYVDVEMLHGWINNAMNVKTYEAMFPFKITPPQFGGKKAVHQWGPCILGMSFRRQPGPPTLTFFTRTQSLGFSGVADYALLHFVCKQLALRMGIPQERIRVQIYAASFVIKMVEAVHTLTTWGRLDEFANADTRIGESIRYYINYMSQETNGADLRWRAANRMRTKWHNAQRGQYRSLPVDNLTLKGWDHHKRTQPRRSSRQVQELVLMGKRGGPTSHAVEVPEEATV